MQRKQDYWLRTVLKMSANNYILIRQHPDKWEVTNRDYEGSEIEKIGEYKDLISAVRASDHYREENTVEYGIDFKLLKP